MCRECFSEYNRKRYLADAEAVKTRARAYHWANRDRVLAEHRERYDPVRAAVLAKAYYKQHKTHLAAYRVEWARKDRAKNPEKYREKSRREYRQNPLARLEIYWRRRAQKAATKALKVTPALLRAKWAYWGGLCWMCGLVACEWDHVKPLSMGGYHCLSNLRPACRSCNARKGNRWPWPRKEC